MAHNKMSNFSSVLMAQREAVLASYNAAKMQNHHLFVKGDDTATEEYIFPNQIYDANNIAHIFYNSRCRVISIQKKTKVGADGLMIEIAKMISVSTNIKSKERDMDIIIVYLHENNLLLNPWNGTKNTVLT